MTRENGSAVMKRIVGSCLELLELRVKSALRYESELWKLAETASTGGEVSASELKEIVKTLNELKLCDVRLISGIIDSMYERLEALGTETEQSPLTPEDRELITKVNRIYERVKGGEKGEEA